MSDDTMRETVRRARELMVFVSPEPDNWDEHNAAIAAALCNQELPALCDDNDRLRADLARVTAERDALRAIVEGQATATSAELDAVEAAGYKLVAAFDDAGEPVRWWVIRDGRLCAWPEVSR